MWHGETNGDAFSVPVSLELVGAGICQMVFKLRKSRPKRAIRCNGGMDGIEQGWTRTLFCSFFVLL
jgi:hypothetical protein